VVFKIDVKPPAPGSPGILRGNGDQPGPDPLPPHSCGGKGVQQERVDGSIPGNVDEANEVRPFPRADPAQAVLVNLGPPVAVQDWVTKRLGVQRVDCGVAEMAAPLIDDHLATVRKTCTGGDGSMQPGPERGIPRANVA